MSKILITGGTGFIGTHVAKEARCRGLEVVILDRYGKPSMYETFLGDVRDAETVREAVQKVDYAINLAGILGTQELVDCPYPAVHTNIIGNLNFLEACRPTQFHAVQGVQIGVGNHTMNNPYSISKDVAERFTLMYAKHHQTKVCVVRAYLAFGERQKHAPVRKMVPHFIVKALRGEDIEVYGNGRQLHDLIYVGDLARILVDACVKEHGVYNRVFEAGRGVPVPVNRAAQVIIDAVGSSSKIVYLPMRPGEKAGASVVGRPATLAALGLQRFRPFESVIEQVVEWYRKYYPWRE